MSKALSVNATASGRQQIFDFLYKWGMLLTVVALVAVFGGVGQLPRSQQHHQYSALDCHRDGDCHRRVDIVDHWRVRSLRGVYRVAGERAGDSFSSGTA